MQPLEPGEPRAIGAYRLLGRLGSGGMGRVYLGRSAGGRTVAVKAVHPHFALDDEFRARFRREVAAARRVGGEWTAPVLDADPEAPVPWVATGYVAGPSLSRAVADDGPLPLDSVRVLGAGLARALEAVHALDLVHRDVKPSNVMLTLEGPRLIDFGISRAVEGTASLTSTGVSVGSPGYMAPEQILGRGVTGAADVFSLGAVLAYAARGEGPFSGDSSAALLYKVVHEEPELGSLDGALRELVTACLAKDPAARPAPAEVAARLDASGADTGRDGWLTAPVVNRISRAAVELLHLESFPDPADPGQDADPAAASGPVPFAPPPAGAFGPPIAPEEAAAAWAKGPGAGSGPGPGPVSGGPGGPGATPASGPGGGPHGPGAGPGAGGGPDGPGGAAGSGPGSGYGPGGVSGNGGAGGAAGSGPGASGSGGASAGPGREPGGLSLTASGGPRGRRVSCTLALTVAGALAAVTLGGAFVLDLLPGSGGGGSNGADAGAEPPAASASVTPGKPGGSVPKEFVGAWQGPITASGIPAGTMKVTLRPAAVGEEAGTAAHTDILGNFICEDLLTVRKAEGRTLVVDSEAGPRSTAVCTKGVSTLRLELRDGELRYASEDDRAGRPAGSLSRLDEDGGGDD
ncbi:serine/threonine-protein kinase [Streptomyces sp. NPDC005805]|uniref:serine/threonine-protein kinase n=1 Tax=Streptomyces sp. NPDC005805 TaxID=3157068 RepID=UPI00340C0FF2